MTDEEVWRAVARGDAEPFNEFYRENAPRLRAFLRQIVGNAQSAEDIAQETFLQIWAHPNGFNPERGTLRAYVFGIGRKRAAEWWRHQHPAEPASAVEPPDELAGGPSLAMDALERLPEEQRSLLWLREIEGQSYAELAATLEVPVGTIRSRLFTAREALRTIWRGEGRQV